MSDATTATRPRKPWHLWVAGIVSLIAMILTTVYSYGFTNGLEVMGGVGPAMFSVVIFAISVLLWLYARAMGRRGVLA